MKNTLSKKIAARLIAQTKEARLLGMSKIAQAAEEAIKKTPVREDEEYTYSDEDFRKDVRSTFWDLIIRAANFYEKELDLTQANDLADHYSDAFVEDYLSFAGVPDVGAHEASLPGQEFEEEDDEEGDDEIEYEDEVVLSEPSDSEDDLIVNEEEDYEEDSEDDEDDEDEEDE